jgi:hypothetical protein
MADVLSGEKKQQVVALGRLGWTLRRIPESILGRDGPQKGISQEVGRR